LSRIRPDENRKGVGGLEGGRGNDSFTVVEVLKPQGFEEERSDDEMASFPFGVTPEAARGRKLY
jgi:hypothetical protein